MRWTSIASWANQAIARRRKPAAVAPLVGQDLGVGEPSCVIDGHVDELPSLRRAATARLAVGLLARAPAGHAVADPGDPPELLDIEMDELAGALALVAVGGSGGCRRERLPRPIRLRTA